MNICIELFSKRRGIAKNDSVWTPGQTIKVKFLDGTDRQRELVMKYAQEWTEYANIKLDFSIHSGVIRVGFRPGQGSWSYVGRSCIAIDNRLPTMNFGWLTENCTEEEARRVILHEFGHGAMGLEHEHESPVSGIKWNIPKVYDFYSGPPMFWNRKQIEDNVLNRYDHDVTNSEFDPDSIMLYAVPEELTLDGFSTKWNMELSNRDKEFVAKLYP